MDARFIKKIVWRYLYFVEKYRSFILKQNIADVAYGLNGSQKTII